MTRVTKQTVNKRPRVPSAAIKLSWANQHRAAANADTASSEKHDSDNRDYRELCDSHR